ncbi:MAG: carboxypeptidase [Actinomycetia bacterium]|nr:carboxypeptidase [Actinomycetes bacterium]
MMPFQDDKGQGEDQPPGDNRKITPKDALGNEDEITPQEGPLGEDAVRNAPKALAQVSPAVPARVEPGYHRFADLERAIKAVALRYQGLIQVESIGDSYEGRSLWMARVTHNVHDAHPDRPAVLMTGGQHAREHLSVEMCLFILQALAGNFGRDPDITTWLQREVVFIVFNVNPDGSEYDFDNGPGTWRKNRQPNPGSPHVGTDLNRNWGWHWDKYKDRQPQSADDYEGPSAFSAPETRALAGFITEHAQEGSERIRAAIDWHTQGEYVLYPFGYTEDLTVPGELTADDRRIFTRLARALSDGIPSANGQSYGVKQSSKYGIGGKSGVIIDWEWGTHHILGFTIEMYPNSSANMSNEEKFLPPARDISRETMRAFGAVRALLREVDAMFGGGPRA